MDDEYGDLLSRLLVDDNDTRIQAEEEYKNVLTNIPNAVMLNFNFLFSENNTTLKSLALILLQHIYSFLSQSHEVLLPDEINDEIISRLLDIFDISQFSNSDLPLVPYVVGFMASYYIERDIEPNFINMILGRCTSIDIPQIVNYVTSISQIIQRLQNKELCIDFASAINFLSNTLNTEINPLIAQNSLRLLYALVLLVGYENELAEFAAVIPELILSFTDPLLSRALSDIFVFLNRCKKFIMGNLEEFMEMVTQIILNDYSESTRIVAIDILTLITRDLTPNYHEFIVHAIETLLQICLLVSEDDISLLPEDITLAGFALLQFTELTQSTCFTSDIVEVTLDFIDSLLEGDWENVYVGISILGRLVISSPADLDPKKEYILETILNQFESNSPMVQIAAFSALTSSIGAFPELISEAHVDIITAFTQEIRADAIPCSCAKAIQQLALYCSKIPSRLLQECFGELMEVIIPMAETNDQLILTNVFYCVSVFASILRTVFADYSELMCNWAAEALEADVSGDLRAAALEMVSVIGECVSPSDFEHAATTFLGAFIEIDWMDLSANEFSSLTAFVSFVAQKLPSVFLVHVDAIMGNLMQLAATRPKQVVHQEFDTEYERTRSRVSYIVESVLVEVQASDIQRLNATMGTIKAVTKAVGTAPEFVNYLAKVKKVCADNMFYEVFNEIAIHSISCLTLFFDIYITIDSTPERTVLTGFTRKYFNMMCKLLGKCTDAVVMSSVYEHLEIAIRKLLAVSAFNMPQFIIRILEFSTGLQNRTPTPSDDASYMVMAAIGRLVFLFFDSFTDEMTAYFGSDGAEVMNYQIDTPNVLQLDAYCAYVTHTGCDDEDELSNLIKAIIENIGEDPYATQEALLLHERLIHANMMDEETVREAPAIIFTTVERSDNVRVRDAGIIAIAAVLETGLELADRASCISEWLKLFPLRTVFDSTAWTYNFLFSLFESGEIQPTVDVIAKILEIAAVVSLGEFPNSVKEGLLRLMQHLISEYPTEYEEAQEKVEVVVWLEASNFVEAE